MQIVNPQTRAAALALSFAALSVPAWAGAPTETVHGEWIAHDFKFHGGEVLSELHIRYTTVGERSGEPVLILHGTGGTGDGLLTQQFAGRLFGPGQPLDAAPETGVTERAMRQLKNARLYLIPASVETRGHGTAFMAKFYEDQLRELLATTPRR